MFPGGSALYCRPKALVAFWQVSTVSVFRVNIGGVRQDCRSADIMGISTFRMSAQAPGTYSFA